MASQLHRSEIKIFCEGKQIVHSLYLGFEILYLCAVLGDIFSLFLADLCDGFGFWANFTCCL